MPDYAARRAAMVEGQLRGRGIWDERVLAAMAAVPREEFVPRRSRYRAYADGALEIGAGQTISQPWIVAAICQELALEGTERVLEVGTGSGYSAAVLSLLAREVISIERDPELARGARRALATLGVHNVHLELGDGSLGDPDRAPFEAIAVHAAAPGVAAGPCSSSCATAAAWSCRCARARRGRARRRSSPSTATAAS